MALGNDGLVYGWGPEENGIVPDPDYSNITTSPKPIAGLSNIIDIAIAQTHAVAIDKDGQVFTWGANGTGELGNGTKSDGIYKPSVVKGIPPMVAATAGNHFTITVDTNGSLWGWGTNFKGELGRGYKFEDRDTDPVPQKVQGITANGFAFLTGKTATEKLESRDDNKLPEESLVSDPIDTSSGALVVNKDLLGYSGVYPFTFSISYNSLLTKRGPLGNGWHSSYEERLEIIDDNKIRIHWNSNKHSDFAKTDVGIYKPIVSNSPYLKIENKNDVYSLHAKNRETYNFQSNGRLISLKIKNKYQLNYSYDDSEKLIKIEQVLPISATSTETHSRSFNLEYNSNNLISKVSDDALRSVIFDYNSDNNLTSITDANGYVNTFTYNPSNQILTGLDNEGVMYLRNEYDNLGRIIKQYDSNGNTTILSYDETTREHFLTTSVTDREGNSKKFTYDENYNLIGVVDEPGNNHIYTYDNKGNRISDTDPNGNETTMEYDDRNNLTRVRDPYGRLINTFHNENNDIDLIQYPMSKWYYYEYDLNGDLTRVREHNNYARPYEINYTYQNGLMTEKIELDGRITKFEYLNGVLVKQIDPEGNITSFKADQLGRIVEQTDPNGNVTYFKYDNNNNQVELTNPLGKSVKNTFDSHNQILTTLNYKNILSTLEYDKNGILISSKLGEQLTKFQYDKEGRLINQISPNNHISSKTYDKAGKIVSETDAEGNKTTFQYDKAGNLISKTQGEDITTYEYDKVGNLISEINALGHKTTYVYNDLNQREEIIDAKGNKTIFRYNFFGSITEKVDSLGHKVRYEYDTLNNLRKIIDARGNETTFEYNLNNKVVKTTNALGQSNQYTYDKNGNLIQSFDALGRVTKKEYDSLNRLVKTTDPLGHSRMLEYDELGNITAVFDAKGNKITSNEYDEYNNLVSITDALGNKVVNKYDIENNLIEIIDQLNRINKQQYDANGKITSKTDSNEVESKMSYNHFGQTTSYVDPNANETSYLYDKLGQITKETNATGNSKTYEYDEIGNVKKFTNGRTQSTDYTYDSVGNVVKKVDEAGIIEYTYDENNNLLTIKETVGEKVKTISREYDQLNRITKYTDEFGNVIQYQYDEVGNIKNVIYPDGKTVSYTYDEVGNMKTVTDWNGNETSYSYDENNQLISTKKPDGSIESREYDLKGQLIKLTNASSGGRIINSYTFEYDAVGNVVKENDNTYAYDSLDRIVSANGRKYSYDNAGNILSAEKTDVNPVKQLFTYGLDNQLSTLDSVSTQYDKDGNLLTIPLAGETAQGSYDSRNRLTAVGDTKYFYNAENKRTAIEENGKVTRFVVNPNNRLDQTLMETDSEGKPTAYYVYGHGLISKGLADGSTSYYHYDRRGSTVALTNGEGEVTDTYTYDIYGEQLSEEGTTENRFRYNGKYGVATDDNGLYYMRARYYNPEIKRFINRDVVQGSILEPQTFNRYAYVNGNPISYIDPFGLSREEDGSLLKGVYNFFIGDDINTLLDPNASSLERALSGLSLASNFVPGGGVALKGLKVVGKLGKSKFIDETISLLKSDKGSFRPFDLTGKSDILNWKEEKIPDDFVEIEVLFKPELGMSKNAFIKKKTQLKDLGENGVLMKMPNPLPPRNNSTSNYRSEIIKKVYNQYGSVNPDFANKAIARIKKELHADHIQDLQLGGADSRENLQLLHGKTNEEFGRQIYRQIKDLPDGTKIKIK